MAIVPFKSKEVLFPEDGTIRDPRTGEIRELHQPAANDDAVTADLVPKLTDINAHLHALFDPAFVQAYPDAWIEIAYGKAATGGAIHEAQNYSVFRPGRSR